MLEAMTTFSRSEVAYFLFVIIDIMSFYPSSLEDADVDEEAGPFIINLMLTLICMIGVAMVNTSQRKFAHLLIFIAFRQLE